MNTNYISRPGVLKASVCTAALLGALMISAPAFSGDASAQTKAQVEKNAQDKTGEKRREILEDAVNALAETHLALKALDEGKTKDALADLEKATGKLEIILARDPALKLAPVNVSAYTADIDANLDTVKTAADEAREDLDKGKVQDARHLLEHLASETVISVENIPLAAYPLAIKNAVKLIDEKKTEEAKVLLQTALNNLVVTETIIPLPIVRAQEMLKEAEGLAENKNRKDDQSKHLSELLTSAETQIRLAAELGYGQKKDFEHFYDEIAKIRDKTTDGKSGVGFFDKIKEYMTSMAKDSQSKKAGHSS